MMPLRTEAIKVRERTHAGLGKLLRRDLAVFIRVHDAENGVHDVVRLLTVRRLVGGLLLRVGMVHAIDSLDFIAVELAISVEVVEVEEAQGVEGVAIKSLLAICYVISIRSTIAHTCDAPSPSAEKIIRVSSSHQK